MSIAEWIYTRLLGAPPLRQIANAALRAIARPSITLGDAIIHLDPDDPVISGALTLGVYERQEIAFYRSILRPGQKVLDIGANIGLYTALAMRAVGPLGRVIAIEPHPGSRVWLEKTIAANRQGSATVDVVAAAAGAQAGTATLHGAPDNRGDNRLYSHAGGSDQHSVSVVRLDEALQSLGMETLDIVKIDVQGYEAHALAGLSGTLARSPRLTLLTEFWPDGLRAAGSDPFAYLAFLRDHGMVLSHLGATKPIADDAALIASLPGRAYTNLVGVKR
jgi:FkbM family methyltransferase